MWLGDEIMAENKMAEVAQLFGKKLGEEFIINDFDMKFKAKFFKSNGKALANKKVKFVLGGKTYKVKTASNGIAKLTVKNMKAGKYKIFTVYGALKNTNTITLKN